MLIINETRRRRGAKLDPNRFPTTTTTILDENGVSYVVTNRIIDENGAAYLVDAAIVDELGTDYTIFT